MLTYQEARAAFGLPDDDTDTKIFALAHTDRAGAAEHATSFITADAAVIPDDDFVYVATLGDFTAPDALQLS